MENWMSLKNTEKLEPFEMKIIKELIFMLWMFEEASDDFQDDFETVGNVIPAYT